MRIPSKSQRQAIAHLSGPCMVIAGPGSGKTFTITSRILSLIHQNIPPENILVITYTRAAAMEMKGRFLRALSESDEEKGKTISGGVNFGTFHSICYHILKQSGLVSENSLIKESEKRKLLQVILENMGFICKEEGQTVPSRDSRPVSYDAVTDLINRISRAKNGSGQEAQTEENAGSFSAEELLLLRKEYDRYLEEQGLIDFDDMIGKCLHLFRKNRNILTKYQRLFSFILVDEFQDINPPQYEILKCLAYPSGNLFVVGDDDQAIYGFRGATPGIMRQFVEDFHGVNQIMLTENYRCGADIVRLAEQMISRNKERFTKEFYSVKPEGKVAVTCFDTRREQEQGLISVLSSLGNEKLSDSAVILRTNREASLYVAVLRKSGIAVKGSRIKREDIWHSFIMQDVSAFLAFLHEGNRRDDFICFMNKPNRFLTRMALPDEQVRQEQLERYYERNSEMRGKVRLLFKQLGIARGLQPQLAVSFFRKTLGYDGYLRTKAGDEKDYQRLLETADQVQNCFKDCKAGVGTEPVRDFIMRRAAESGYDKPLTEKEMGVNIVTMHGSKGLEFQYVFLPDLNEGVIPGKEAKTEKALEEERRLLYVAVTRAVKELHLYCTRERGREPSRYLEGIVKW